MEIIKKLLIVVVCLVVFAGVVRVLEEFVINLNEDAADQHAQWNLKKVQAQLRMKYPQYANYSKISMSKLVSKATILLTWDDEKTKEFDAWLLDESTPENPRYEFALIEE